MTRPPESVYPRVGGGTQSIEEANQKLLGLSPRGRGNPRSPERRLVGKRSIPAWAGEPQMVTAAVRHYMVYPRVGGGTPTSTAITTRTTGLSPRGRGNRGEVFFMGWRSWSIPAWAGEPNGHARILARLLVYPRVGGGTHYCCSDC